MKRQIVPIYQIDAFTDHIFGGNPAAVCLLEQWPEDKILQQVASENNLSETTFLVKNHGAYKIRWFTPIVEVDLCGHATLAAAHVLFNIRKVTETEIYFESESGKLLATREHQNITLDFPADQVKPHKEVPGLFKSLGLSNGLVYKGKTDLMVVVDEQETVASLSPDFQSLGRLPVRGIIVTAPGKEVDFVSRFFAPYSGINEDPVTGSAHCTMTPYWSEQLGKTNLEAVQLSPRKGVIRCKLAGDRVKLTGSAVTYMSGTISL